MAIYLYPLWIRLWHWSNALLFLLLIVSGATIHFAGDEGLLPFESALLLHNIAGLLLIAFWLLFVVGNSVSRNGRHYRLQWRGVVQRLLRQSGYYAVGIFRGEPHPFHPSTEMKFNTLQQISYLGVMYGLMPALISSGLLFLFPGVLPERLLGVESLWVVAMGHLLVAYLLLLFVVVHLYIITIGDSVFTHLRAMWSGWHRSSDDA